MHPACLAGFEPVVVNVEASLGANIDHVVHRCEHAVVVTHSLHERNGNVGAGDEFLDQHPGGISAQGTGQKLAQAAQVAGDRVVGDAFGRALEVGLDDHGVGQAKQADVASSLHIVGHDHASARGVDPLRGQDKLGHPLVQGHRHHVGVRASVREAQLLEESRIERLAAAPAPSLRGVEDQIGGERLDTRGQVRRRTGNLDLLDLVTTDAEPVGNRVDGRYAVKFCLLFAVGKTEVVGKCDLHAMVGARMGSLSRTDLLSKKLPFPSTNNDVWHCPRLSPQENAAMAA